MPTKKPTKERVMLYLSSEVIAFFKAKGKDWKMRIDEAVKAFVAVAK
jgi:uncharacterized protein (DUF4415 family)